MTKTILFNNIEFTQIKDFKDYYVSRCGKVLSTKKYKRTMNKLLKGNSNTFGYLMVTLFKNKKRNYKQIHRIVALTFIPNLENKPCVNHIDGDKTNNDIINLEWCTYSENTKHSFRILCQKPNKNMLGKFGKLHHNSRKVNQYDLEGNFIKTWDCAKDIERELNYYHSTICLCCNKKQKTAGGFKWEYF